MGAAISDYFSTLLDRFGSGWNKFWFTPSDPLVLATIRIFTALGGLAWYLSYAPDLVRLFGPNGLFSVSKVYEWSGAGGPVFSIFNYADTPGLLWFLYVLGIVFLVMMLVGLLTRVATIGALVMVTSLLWRGPMLYQPADQILALLLFYTCLGPAGARLSLDKCLLGRRKTADAAVPEITEFSSATIAVRLIQVHIAAIYAAMAIAQLKGQTWWIGTAVWGMAARPESRLLDLTPMLSSESLIYLVNAWTHFLLLFEGCFALLIWNRLARPLILALGIVYWLSIAVLTGMVGFAYFMLVAALAFVPADVLKNCCTKCCSEKVADKAPAAA